jgi:hypothetical protein
MPPFGFRVPGLAREAAFAAEFGRVMRAPLDFTGFGQ